MNHKLLSILLFLGISFFAGFSNGDGGKKDRGKQQPKQKNKEKVFVLRGEIVCGHAKANDHAEVEVAENFKHLRAIGKFAAQLFGQRGKKVHTKTMPFNKPHSVFIQGKTTAHDLMLEIKNTDKQSKSCKKPIVEDFHLAKFGEPGAPAVIDLGTCDLDSGTCEGGNVERDPQRIVDEH